MELDVRQGVVLRPGEGEPITAREDQTVTLKLDFDQLSAFESWCRSAQEGASPHIHRRHADAFFVVEGELELWRGDERVKAPAGTTFCAPPGLVHGFVSTRESHYLNFHTPDAGFAESRRLRRDKRPHEPTDYDSWSVPENGGPPASEAIVVGSCEGERLTDDNRQALVKIARDELALIEFTLEPGFEGPKPHVHKRHVDSFFVLEGEVEFRVGDETTRLGAGSCVAASPSVVHSFGRPGPQGARLINVHAPSCDFPDYLRALDELARRGMEPGDGLHARHDVFEI